VPIDELWENFRTKKRAGVFSRSGDERDAVREALEGILQDQAADDGRAYLPNPVDSGIGKK